MCYQISLSLRKRCISFSQSQNCIIEPPLYCGILVHKTLGKGFVEGVHEKLICRALFLKINNIIQTQQGNYGIPHQKEQDQKLLFPEGIYYEAEKGAVRTGKMNSVFALVSSLAKVLSQKEKGQSTSENALSPYAETGGQSWSNLVEDLQAIAQYS